MKAVSLSDVTAHITPTSVTSPVSTAAKATDSSVKMSSAPIESEIAFPAVLKGSQKQRVPPPVPPRGSPKSKRGASSHLSLDMKGEYLSVVSDAQFQTAVTSSDDDFNFFGHDFSYEPDACRVPSVKLTELVSSNSLDYAEEGLSITETCNLTAQTSMMANFNIDKIVREHLDSGDYNDTSFTESSSEDQITSKVSAELNKANEDKIPKIIPKILDKTTQSNESLTEIGPIERVSVHNIKSSDLISAAKCLKKVTKSTENLVTVDSQTIVTAESKSSKVEPKTGIITGITKKMNPLRKDKIIPKTPKPKVEIRTYTEGRSKGGMTKDEVVCHRKAKTKIDLFQKQILKLQSDSENSSRRSSMSSLYDSNRSIKFEKSVNEAKKVFETVEEPKLTKVKPTKSFSGNVHDKIKQFSESTLLTSTPHKIPRQKIKGSVKKKTERKKIFLMKKDIEEIL